MHRTIVRALRNISREEGELPTDKPIILESYEEHAEDHNQAESVEVSRILQEDLERIKPSKPQSNHRLLWPAIVTCLILITALLVGLLILSKKLSQGCGCLEERGPQRLKSQPPRGISSEEDGTNISDLVKSINSDLNSLRAAIDGTKSDLTAKLNSTMSTIENFNSDLNDMKTAVDGTKKDLGNLNTTITKIENLNSDLIDVKAALDGTKNDLADLNSTVEKGRDKPSAHIGSRFNRSKTYKAKTVLKDWSTSTNYSHLAGGMTYHDGSLTVPTPGRYYIYAQIYYNKCERVAVRVNGNTITMIQPQPRLNRAGTLNAAGLFQLKAGDVISLYAVREIKVYLERRHTYFGAFLI